MTKFTGHTPVGGYNSQTLTVTIIFSGQQLYKILCNVSRIILMALMQIKKGILVYNRLNDQY